MVTECCVCLELVSDELLGGCAHCVCSTCVKAIKVHGNNRCPMCRGSLSIGKQDASSACSDFKLYERHPEEQVDDSWLSI